MNAAERVAAEVDYLRSLTGDARTRYRAGLGHGLAAALTRDAADGDADALAELAQALERSTSATQTAWRNARRAVTDSPETIAARERATARRRLGRGLSTFGRSVGR